jgi:hypothetical protein
MATMNIINDHADILDDFEDRITALEVSPARSGRRWWWRKPHCDHVPSRGSYVGMV